MRLNTGFLGTRPSSTLVDLAMQQLRIPWTLNSGRWQNGGEASRKMGKAEAPSKALRQTLGVCFSA